MKLKIDHIGYVVENIKETKEYFKKIYKFKSLTNFIYEKAHGVNITFIDLGNNSTPALELIEPTSKKSKVYNFLHQKGGGMHHLAYEVEDVEKTMTDWKEKGYVEFLSEEPLTCQEPKLTQVFSKPSELTGVIYELIKREDNKGFCEKNVEQLMESTR